MEFADINIESIRIIVKKRERDLFDFYNEGKVEDGFVLFTEGSVRFFKDGEEPVLLKKGSLVLLRKHDRYRFRCDTGCTYVTAEFSFSADSEPTLKTLPRHIICPKELQGTILEGESFWQSQRWDRHMLCRIRLLELYTELLHQTHAPATRAGERIAEQAKDYLHLHFKENFSTADIAAHCNISPSHLRTVFEKETGTTITEFRNRLRISTAKEMLKSGLFTVKETAAELGYCDVYYFSKIFKQTTGLSPARFKGR